ncbi:MAG: cyclic nucleotide-binding domain-containing protein [Burkholderiales bacterium]|nr:cyclic nucleotide-binding domain-containing protein [Burkholderiales bacterium]MCW5576822.1 cyclic nucleotide-binding domain-containing protein [Burkholderiales bacterium]MCW5606084.1 cyclic nucleotide-binding domain-containing protein [Burkholderiales bacterium]
MPAPAALNPQILKSVPLFSSFSDDQIATVASWGQHRSYPRGSAILRAGEETDGLYIILSGRVKVLIPDEEGREVILSLMGAQEFVGEMGLLDGLPSSATVETLEPCEILRLPRTAFLSCLQGNGEVAMLVLRNLVRRLREADRKIESLALIDVYGRVARLIIDMAEEIDGQWVVQRAPAKQEIARMIGASREMVSRVVKDLQEKNLIRTEKRKIFVVDRQSMAHRGSA